jgi:hypothetical protein
MQWKYWYSSVFRYYYKREFGKHCSIAYEHTFVKYGLS